MKLCLWLSHVVLQNNNTVNSRDNKIYALRLAHLCDFIVLQIRENKINYSKPILRPDIFTEY